MATTDFETWIYENVEINDINDVSSLYQAITSESENYYPYSAHRKNNVLYVKNTGKEETLAIVNDNARTAFINILEYPYLEQGGIEMAKVYNDHMSHD